MADETPTLDDLTEVGNWTRLPEGAHENQVVCNRCGSLVGQAAGYLKTHERWHAAIESLTITVNILDGNDEMFRLLGERIRRAQHGHPIRSDAEIDAAPNLPHEWSTQDMANTMVGQRQALEYLREVVQAAGCPAGTNVIDWLRRRLAELLELRAELAKRDAVLQPAKQATVATAEQAIDQFIATIERSHQPGRFDAHCFACSWTTDGNESVVEDAVYEHATEHHVRKPEPVEAVWCDRCQADVTGENHYHCFKCGARTSMMGHQDGCPPVEPCRSLCLHDGRLLTCCVTGGPHATHISNQPNQKTDERLSWTDDQAVPVPWPTDQEPPAGIDILQDTGDQQYLCRETDGWVWWSTLDARNDFDGDACDWADVADDVAGQLIVVRPPTGANCDA